MLRFLLKGALALGAAGLILEGVKKLNEKAEDEKASPADDAAMVKPAEETEVPEASASEAPADEMEAAAAPAEDEAVQEKSEE